MNEVKRSLYRETMRRDKYMTEREFKAFRSANNLTLDDMEDWDVEIGVRKIDGVYVLLPPGMPDTDKNLRRVLAKVRPN